MIVWVAAFLGEHWGAVDELVQIVNSTWAEAAVVRYDVPPACARVGGREHLRGWSRYPAAVGRLLLGSVVEYVVT